MNFDINFKQDTANLKINLLYKRVFSLLGDNSYLEFNGSPFLFLHRYIIRDFHHQAISWVSRLKYEELSILQSWRDKSSSFQQYILLLDYLHLLHNLFILWFMWRASPGVFGSSVWWQEILNVTKFSKHRDWWLAGDDNTRHLGPEKSKTHRGCLEDYDPLLKDQKFETKILFKLFPLLKV